MFLIGLVLRFVLSMTMFFPSFKYFFMRVFSTVVTFPSASFGKVPWWYSFPKSCSLMVSLFIRTLFLGSSVTHFVAQVLFPEAEIPLVMIISFICFVSLFLCLSGVGFFGGVILW